MTLKLALTIEGTAEIMSLGRSATYEAVRRGIIPSIRIGRRIVVPRRALERMLEEASVGGKCERTVEDGRNQN